MQQVEEERTGQELSGCGLPIRSSYDQAAKNGLSIAENFSRLVENIKTAPFNEYLDETILKIIPELNLPDDFVMADLACGNGKTLRRIQSEHAQGSWKGFDLSAEMVRLAREQSQDIKFEQGDIRDLEEGKENLYDLVTCVNAVHYLPTIEDVKLAYRCAYRLLKPGGHYLMVTGDHASTASWRNMSEDELKEWIAKGRKPMNWSMPDEEGRMAFSLYFYPYMNEEHTEALEECGFEKVGMKREYPPSERIGKYNPEVFKMLSTEPCFIFVTAAKPSILQKAIV